MTTPSPPARLVKKITVDVKGEIAELKNTINTMVDQLNGFASEVTRVAREVGTEGKLGKPGRSEGRRSVRERFDGLGEHHGRATSAKSPRDTPNGDLSKKIAVDVKAEILELKNTINTMVDQLSTLRRRVTAAPRMGTEGKLGGQAQVKGVAASGKTSPIRELHGREPDRTGDETSPPYTAVANGDFLGEDHGGREGRDPRTEKDTINTMVDQLAAPFFGSDAACGPRSGHRRKTGAVRPK